MSEQVEILTPLQKYEFLESFYELSDDSHFWYKWRAQAFLQQLKDLQIPLNDNLKVLDIGGGKGVLRKQLEAVTNWDIDVTDLDYNGLQQAIAGRGRTMYYDINEKRPEFKEKYDAILLFDVLEHIEHTKPFIQSLLFHLNRGG
jgi:2-polyprenyl-3-methyl-5-hydroxy-6-metoxy-1,4-benzoquinol methylase